MTNNQRNIPTKGRLAYTYTMTINIEAKPSIQSYISENPVPSGDNMIEAMTVISRVMDGE
jgi:hypothetical protein